MQTTKSASKAEYALSFLPHRVENEIRNLARSRRGGLSSLREIRIRESGRSTLMFSDENIPLLSVVSGEEVEAIVKKLSDGALYAHRDSIASGYISIGEGIRVGVVGAARYEYKSFVGISHFSSLVFRIPTGECAFADELYAIFREGVGAGMLIYSPPGIGKTTALRSLAHSIGSGEFPMRVAVIDERCEFSREDYLGDEVDVLSGYKKSAGIEIATRTMSPEVLIIDEIGAEDVSALLSTVRAGIPLIAAAHAGSFEELRSRPSLSPLFSSGAFDVFVGIGREDGVYRLTRDRI